MDEKAERAAFEAWCWCQSNGVTTWRISKGDYLSNYGAELWPGWKARAALAAERDALRERVIRDLEAAIGGVPGVIRPPGTPGSYARGEHNGLIHALHIVRAALAQGKEPSNG